MTQVDWKNCSHESRSLLVIDSPPVVKCNDCGAVIQGPVVAPVTDPVSARLMDWYRVSKALDEAAYLLRISDRDRFRADIDSTEYEKRVAAVLAEVSDEHKPTVTE